MIFTALSFLNTTKYSPSLAFLLMTLGPPLIALVLLDRIRFSSANPLIVFGRVPFFYYVGHMLLAHVTEIVLNLVRYGAKPFLWLAPPSMSSPANLFPPLISAFRSGRSMRSGWSYLRCFIPPASGSFDSSSGDTIGGSVTSRTLLEYQVGPEKARIRCMANSIHRVSTVA